MYQIKRLAVMFTLAVITGVAYAAEIKDVMVRQRWPWSRKVDIEYVLECEVGGEYDIQLQAYNGTVPLLLPLDSLSGDIFAVRDGARRIVWDPTLTSYVNDGVMTNFRVELIPMTKPLYMVIDLTKDANSDGQIEYVYEDVLRNGEWGTWVENPVTNNGTPINSIVWTGVINNESYKTDKMVLRRIPSGKFTIGGFGYTPNEVTFSRECYVGVFQVTVAQWAYIMDGSGGDSTLPKNMVSYDMIRGATNSTPRIDWPSTGREVASGSFIYKLRTNTGLPTFDLPTESQWEYMCRAGTTTLFNDGSEDALYSGNVEENNGDTNKYLHVLGWYKANSNNEIHPVGQKKTNAWGLYDMHGNLWEWCLDWWSASMPSGPDPVGPESGTKDTRLARGGSYGHSAAHNRSAYRLSSVAPHYNSGPNYGFRVVLNLP